MASQIRDNQERRRFARVKSLHLTSFVPKQGDAPLAQVSMGRTLDLSAVGTKIEVYQPIEPMTRVELEIAIEEKITRAHGTVVHQEATEQGSFLVGIEFDQLQTHLQA